MWEAANGPIPDGYYIDHIDGNPLNDDLSNLRLALPKENSWNMKTPKSNTTGLKVYRGKLVMSHGEALSSRKASSIPKPPRTY